MWIELAEAKLNYAFGQTDTLLDALEVTRGSKSRSSTPQKVLLSAKSCEQPAETHKL